MKRRIRTQPLQFKPIAARLASLPPPSLSVRSPRAHEWSFLARFPAMTSRPPLEQHYLFRLPHVHLYGDYIWPGMITSAERLACIAQATVNFNDKDIIIASYPKSGIETDNCNDASIQGTTWTSELVSAIVHRGDIALLRSKRQDERVPWLELDKNAWWIKFFYVWKKLFGFENDPPPESKTTRVWFTHLPVELLPPAMLAQCKIIYVSRNPKDTAVSFFHFHRMARFLGLQKTTWDEFFPLFVSGKLYTGSWFEHVLGFWRLSKIKKESMLFLKYEEMKKAGLVWRAVKWGIEDLAGEVDRLSSFLNVELTADERSRVITHCSFESMSGNAMANRAGVWLFDQKVSPFMRRGVVGDWTNYFTVAQSRFFDRLFETRMAESQLTYDFV